MDKSFDWNDASKLMNVSRKAFVFKVDSIEACALGHNLDLSPEEIL